MPDLSKQQALAQAKAQWNEEGKAAPGENTSQHTIKGREGGTVAVTDEDLPVLSVVHLQNNKGVRFELKASKIVKLLIEGCDDCTIVIQGCVLITGTCELWSSSRVRFETDKRIETFQIDMCKEITVVFAKSTQLGQVVQAAVYDLHLEFTDRPKANIKTGMAELKAEVDDTLQLTDTTSQFVTRFVEGELLTEKIIRLANDFPTTMREKDTFAVQQQATEEKMAKLAGDILGDLKPNEKANLTTLQAKHADSVSDTQSSKDYGPEVRAEVKKGKGNAAFKEGNIPQAVIFYTQSIEVLPTAAVHANRAACFLSLKQPDSALTDAEACLALDEKYVKAHFRKGLALMDLKKFPEACAAFARTLELEPANKAAKASLGMASMKATKAARGE